VREPWRRRLARWAWRCLDIVTAIMFSIGVWILSDLPNGWAAWKWQREQKRRQTP